MSSGLLDLRVEVFRRWKNGARGGEGQLWQEIKAMVTCE